MKFSVADPGCWSQIRILFPSRIRIFPSRIRIKEFKYLTQKIVSRLLEIWSGSRSWFFTHPGSWIQGSKRHRIRIRNTLHFHTVIWRSLATVWRPFAKMMERGKLSCSLRRNDPDPDFCTKWTGSETLVSGRTVKKLERIIFWELPRPLITPQPAPLRSIFLPSGFSIITVRKFKKPLSPTALKLSLRCQAHPVSHC